LSILIAGDLVPTQDNIHLFINGDVTSLLGEELSSLWKTADMRIFNLEVPLTDKESPIPKCGPNLMASTSSVKGIKELNPTLLTLANNHIFDQGVNGLKSTEKILNENNIPFVGIGNNVNEASKPYILNYNHLKIGVYSCAENEFTIATKSNPGANPFDPLESLDHISHLKQQCDYVIVLYHGGKEHYRYPSPNLQKICKKMVEKGADLIVCQHSHCVGCYEEYNGSTIIYGQGNFIFNKYDNEFWNTSILIQLNIDNGLQVDYIPIVKEEYGIRLATGPIAEDILADFEGRSQDLLIEGFVEEKYKKFAREQIDSYLRSFSGFGKWMSRIDRKLLKGSLVRRKYSKKQKLAMQNYIECEAHRELILTALKGETEIE